MDWRIPACALAFWLATGWSSFGQPAVRRFENLSVADGLSQSDVYAIHQDHLGFLWFGTQDGLNCFDGYRFTAYRSDPDRPKTLRGDFINVIHEDQDHNLWIGTRDGLHHFNRQMQEFDTLSELAGGASPNDPIITALAQDVHGNLWIGTERGGLHIWDPQLEQLTSLDLPGMDLRITSLLMGDDEMMAGTGAGIYTIDVQKRSSIQGPRLADLTIQSLLQDHQGTLWVGTSQGLFRGHRGGDLTFYQETGQDTIWSLFEDRQANLWVGTAQGLVFLDSNGSEFQRLRHQPGAPWSLASDDVRSIFQDRSGVLWVATRGSGLNKLANPISPFRHFVHQPGDPHGLNDSLVWEIYEDLHGVIWIGTKAGGLNRVDPIRGTFSHYRHDPNDPHSIGSDWVFAVLEDQARDFWVATSGGGLNRLNRDSGRFERWTHRPTDKDSLPNDRVFALLEDGQRVLWIATNQGLASLDPSRQTMQVMKHSPNDPNTIGDDQIRALYEDHHANLWIGSTRGGITVLDSNREVTTHYRHRAGDPHSLANNWVLSITQDSQGYIWVGTDGGLNRIDGDGTMHCYRLKDGLPNEVIYGVLPDSSGNVWVTTNNGLSRLDPYTELFQNYDVLDGLLSNEFNQGAYCSLRNGEFLVGGIGGVTRFDPNALGTDPIAPQVAISRLLISNKTVPISSDNQPTPLPMDVTGLSELVLTRREAMFAFEFTALHFVAPQRNRFAYRMSGVHHDWIETSSENRMATFTRLAPGTHQFEVKAANKDGVWSQPRRITVRVLPPPWRSAWAYALYAFSLIGLFAWAARARLLKTRERAHAQQQIAEREERLRLALWGSGDELWDWDLRSGDVHRENPLPGIVRPSKVENRAERPPQSVVHRDDEDLLKVAIKQHLSGASEVFEATYRVQHESGEWVWVTARGQVVEVDAEGPVRVAGTTTNITRVKQAEEALIQLNAQLENRVEDRTRDLNEAQHRLIDLAHRAGMAEIAAGVLHNIGNILNSVNISTECLWDRVQKSKLADMKRVYELMCAQDGALVDFLTKDPKGRLIPEYLQAVLPALLDDNQKLTKEIEQLRASVRMMTDVIHTQQSYATAGLYTVNTDVTEIVEDGLKLMHTSLQRYNIKVEREYRSRPQGNLPRVRLVHVITNLIKNARDAMAEHNGQDTRRLVIIVDKSNQYEAIIKVRDTGTGIHADHIDRIFNHGFTTKRDGHGFGLHTCANALAEMGGRLTVTSDGIGKGATFTVHVPLEAQTGSPARKNPGSTHSP